ncbi:hypothetical protein KSS87_007941, partial [Heliosperma pusillum]
MASHLLFISFFLLYFSTRSSSSSPPSDKTPQSYIVYMGASSGEGDMKVEELGHLELLSSIIPSEEAERVSVGHVYEHAFRGFSALLTHAEASLLSENEEIISVFRDPIMKLHTTRSWEFLNEESGVPSDFQSRFPQSSTDVIIGLIDTGVWPESPSFSDKDMGEVPRRWKGTCMEGSDFKKSACNRKLIGARYYSYQDGLQKYSNTSAAKSTSSPRDHDGHGTHTASIAAGARVANASYFGLAKGTAKGGSSRARIAIYKACSLDSCSGSEILKAIDDAVKDGVDIISLSLGMDLLLGADFYSDPIAIGSFHANEMGVMVGTGITLSNLTASSQYPLAFAGDVAAEFAPPSEARRPTATILSTVTVEKFKPAPVVADFSSRGPGEVTENILKPDIIAPGVAILGAYIPQSEPIQVPAGKKASKFAVKSGTSMACPHVSGAAAFVKSVHHEWTPSMIKSALMTTATIADNMGRFLRNSSDIANPHETGAGEISPVKALDPGLVFPTGVNDYFNFLCYCGYSKKNLRSMSSTKFTCPKVSSDQLISNINYPSISIGGLKKNETTSVTRHVINVGSSNATYTALYSINSVISGSNRTLPRGPTVGSVTQSLMVLNLSLRLDLGIHYKGAGTEYDYNILA